MTLPNRTVVAPMCQYSVADGIVGDYHLVQDDPNWAVHAARTLTGGSYDVFPEQAGPRLASRDRLLGRLGPWIGPEPVQVAESA